MSVFSQTPFRLLLIAAVALFTLTGCPKRPVRPDPSQTIGDGTGMNGYGSEDLNATDVGLYDDDLLDPSAGGLEVRDGSGIYEDDEIIRGLLEPVFFDFDKSGISASERVKLDAAINYLDANPQHGLLLEGHCDWRGTGDYNLGLGDRRSGAAREYLETAGVDPSRLETSSKGDLEAIENGDDAQMAQDRRVELVILKN